MHFFKLPKSPPPQKKKKIEHLFWYYATSLRNFGKILKIGFTEKNQYLVNIDKKRVNFGICDQNGYNKSINYILILKKIIYL